MRGTQNITHYFHWDFFEDKTLTINHYHYFFHDFGERVKKINYPTYLSLLAICPVTHLGVFVPVITCTYESNEIKFFSFILAIFH